MELDIFIWTTWPVNGLLDWRPTNKVASRANCSEKKNKFLYKYHLSELLYCSLPYTTHINLNMPGSPYFLTAWSWCASLAALVLILSVSFWVNFYFDFCELVVELCIICSTQIKVNLVCKIYFQRFIFLMQHYSKMIIFQE